MKTLMDTILWRNIHICNVKRLLANVVYSGVPLPVAKCNKNLEFGENSQLEIANLANPRARMQVRNSQCWRARERYAGKMRERRGTLCSRALQLLVLMRKLSYPRSQAPFHVLQYIQHYNEEPQAMILNISSSLLKLAYGSVHGELNKQLFPWRVHCLHNKEP